MGEKFTSGFAFGADEVLPFVWWDDSITESCIRPANILIEVTDRVTFSMTTRDGKNHIAFVISIDNAHAASEARWTRQ